MTVNGSTLAASTGNLDDATPSAPAGGFNVKWQKDALGPTNISAYVDYGAGLTVTAGELVADFSAVGSTGTNPFNEGTSTQPARRDHEHRDFAQLSWFFPGLVVTGVQSMTLTLPEGIGAPAITDMRMTVNTTGGSSSTVNIQRCTASCTGVSPTFANIYSTNLTLNTNTRTASKGSAPDQNVSGLAAGDQFKVNLVTVGTDLADVTVTMTYKYRMTN